MQREFAIALRARSTWLVLAVAALLVGHSFVLAVDLFSASSRSALASLLQAREMDPLAGIVRPTLGGLSLAVSILGPVVAARPLAIEKERRSYGALALATGSTFRVVAAKAIASSCALAVLLAVPSALFVAFHAAGGHLDVTETAVALSGEALHVGLVVAISVAAAAWTETFAQAVTLGVVASLTAWAIDVAEGFAALAWLGRASEWSIEQRLLPFQRGTVSLGSLSWLSLAIATAFTLACVGGTFGPPRRKLLSGLLVLGVGVVALWLVAGVRRAYDWSESRRASLPPAAVQGLRAVASPIELDVYLDRDDSRRTQLERDALAKLSLARPDISIRMPLDAAVESSEALRDADYGRLVIRVGDRVRETRSSSRREIVTLIFEAVGQKLPDWSQPAYSGYPVVLAGARRGSLVTLAYVGIPCALALLGIALTLQRSAR